MPGAEGLAEVEDEGEGLKKRLEPRWFFFLYFTNIFVIYTACTAATPPS